MTLERSIGLQRCSADNYVLHLGFSGLFFENCLADCKVLLDREFPKPAVMGELFQTRYNTHLELIEPNGLGAPNPGEAPLLSLLEAWCTPPVLSNAPYSLYMVYQLVLIPLKKKSKSKIFYVFPLRFM